MKPVRVVIDSTIEVDATLTEKHTATVEITRYPVEEGISPTDHAREAPEKVSVEGIFSNTPVSRLEQENDRIIVNEKVQRDGPGSPGAKGHAQKQLDVLLALKSARRAVTVSGPLRIYKNMILVSLEYTRDSKTGDAVKFTAQFEQIRFVSSRKAEIQNTTQVADKTTKKKEQGKKPTEPVPESVGASTLKDLTDFGGVTKPGDGITR